MSFTRSGRLLSMKFNEYLIPTILSTLSILLSAFVDGIIVSWLIGEDAFSAVNLSDPVVLVMQTLFFLFGIGGAICISVARGQRDERKANALYTLSFIASLTVSLIVTVAGVLFIDPITHILCNEPKLMDAVRSYVLINLLGSVLLIFVPYLVYILRADGMPKLSANILLISNGINLVMDMVYMGVFKMDIRGAALATLTGYFVGLLIEVYFLFVRRKGSLRLVRLARHEIRYLGELCLSSLASVINTVFLFVKAILLNRIVIRTGGQNAIAVFSVCNFTVMIVSLFTSGGCDTMTPIMSLLYGEKDHKGMDFVLRRTFLFELISCSALVIFFEAFPGLLLDLFSIKTPECVEMGIPAIRIFVLSFLVLGICSAIMNYLQATKHKVLSLVVPFLRGLVIIVPLAYGLSLLWGVTGIWWSFILSELLTLAIILVICFVLSRVRSDVYSGIMLHERQTDIHAVYDVSLTPGSREAVEISRDLTEFCLNNGVDGHYAERTGLLAKEMVENIRRFNEGAKKQPQVDLICRITGAEILLSIRDNGEAYDAFVVDDAGDDLSGLKAIRDVADEVSFTRTLGMNNVLVVVKNKTNGDSGEMQH